MKLNETDQESHLLEYAVMDLESGFGNFWWNPTET